MDSEETEFLNDQEDQGMSQEQVPAEVQEHVDRLIADFFAGKEVCASTAYNEYTSWLEENERYGEYNDSFVAVYAPEWIGQLTENIADYLDAPYDEDDDEQQSKGYREVDLVAAMRDDLAIHLEYEQDPDVVPHYRELPMHASDGRSATIVCSVKGYSFSGITVEWHGVHENFSTFRAKLRQDGHLTDMQDFDCLGREGQLRLWYGGTLKRGGE